MRVGSYEKIRTWFLEKEWRMMFLRAAYRGLPLVVAAGYPVCLLVCFLSRRELFLRAVLVPAAMFFFVSAFRHIADFPRPYERGGILPLIAKDKKGHSFPSRHAASAGMIAAVWMAVWMPGGILFSAVAVLVAASRVLAGVHHVRDVLFGGVFGFFAVWIFFV
ncbi:MAG: phosphatase PAP2 family protein [Lachnospiraceae bacterium]|nr:phosphatase PAP2 family protein [Lachnospiraceae bacterium]